MFRLRKRATEIRIIRRLEHTAHQRQLRQAKLIKCAWPKTTVIFSFGSQTRPWQADISLLSWLVCRQLKLFGVLCASCGWCLSCRQTSLGGSCSYGRWIWLLPRTLQRWYRSTVVPQCFLSSDQDNQSHILAAGGCRVFCLLGQFCLILSLT